MSHYKPYPAYKDSGVEWLGRVPEHWAINQMKSGIKSLQNGIWGDEPTGGPDDVGCARVADFDRTRLVVEDPLPTLRSVPQEQRAYKNVRSGDLLLEKSGGGEQTTVGAMVQYLGESEVVCSNFVASVKCKEGVSARWLCYANNHLYSLGVNTRSIKQTTGIQNLDSNQYSAEPIAFPAYAEQQAIAARLDRETTRIDALIAKKTCFIELLKEKRQALITQVVTKGLDPNVKLKESGVEWLGEVPDHWSLKPLKYISPSLTVGIVVNPSDYVTDEGLPFLYGGDIGEGKIYFDTARRISTSASERNSKTKLMAGDLVTVRVGAPGITAVVPPECEGGNCASVMLIRKGDFNSEWLCFLMNSRVVRYQVEVVQYGAAQEQFNIGHAVEFLVPTPPIEEQNRIVIALNFEVRRIDVLLRKTRFSIDFLKERRSALITAAVTGQIDLREAA